MIDLKGNPFFLKKEEIRWIKDTISSLTSEEKAGQLFVVLGNTFSKEERVDLVKKYCIGGVLFRPDTKRIVKEEYDEMSSISQIPLLKASNLEDGGTGAITDGTSFGSQEEVAACKSLRLVEKFAKCCAKEGNEVGINWTFSPVSDIDYNYLNPIMNIRTFGSDPELVKAYATAYMKAVQDQGMISCAKHFPGDGVDYRDQHLHPTVNSLSNSKWYETYGNIYKSLIDNGILSIMVAHILAPNVVKDYNDKSKDITLPGSLNRTLLKGVLRKRLNFNGLIVSDATIMGGYTIPLKRKDALITSINAGVDMLVFNTDFYEDYSFILQGIKEGRISTTRLDEAVTRILALKAKIKFRKERPISIDAKEVQKEISRKSITLVKEQKGLIPLTRSKYDSIRIVILGEDELLPEGRTSKIVSSLLEKEGFDVSVYVRETDCIHGVNSLSKRRLTLYLANEKTASNRTTIRLDWNPIHALDGPRFPNEEDYFFVSLSNPYHLQDVPYVKTYINCYGCNITNLTCLCDKLMGRDEFVGHNPCDPFCGLEDTHY